MPSIFFNKITVVDHSRIDSQGESIGGSYNLNFTASLPSGKMGEEQVVVDFSSGKKDVKKIIDQHLFLQDQLDNGWDHKTWVPTGNPKILFSIKTFSDKFPLGIVETPFLKMQGALDAFKLIKTPHLENPNLEMTEYIQKNLAPGPDGVKYNVLLDEEPYPSVFHEAQYDSTRIFRYEHGLRHSTSYGCKNILHGHLSFVRVGHFRNVANKLAGVIAESLHNAYVYHKDIKHGDIFSYSTSRGDFSLEFKFHKKLIELNVEPTIENIFYYIIEKTKREYPDLMQGVEFIEISEGLQKGACVVFSK
jgi:hypothetical protein